MLHLKTKPQQMITVLTTNKYKTVKITNHQYVVIMTQIVTEGRTKLTIHAYIMFSIYVLDLNS